MRCSPAAACHATQQNASRSDGAFEELYNHAVDDGTDFDAMDTENLAYDAAQTSTTRAFFAAAREVCHAHTRVWLVNARFARTGSPPIACASQRGKTNVPTNTRRGNPARYAKTVDVHQTHALLNRALNFLLTPAASFASLPNKLVLHSFLMSSNLPRVENRRRQRRRKGVPRSARQRTILGR